MIPFLSTITAKQSLYTTLHPSTLTMGLNSWYAIKHKMNTVLNLEAAFIFEKWIESYEWGQWLTNFQQCCGNYKQCFAKIWSNWKLQLSLWHNRQSVETWVEALITSNVFDETIALNVKSFKTAMSRRKSEFNGLLRSNKAMWWVKYYRIILPRLSETQ